MGWLAESSNKSLVRIIKKLLTENKKAWDSNLKYALWADRVSTKKSIGTSPFQLVYGIDAILPVHLSLRVMKFLQDEIEETNDVQRRIFQLVELQQHREAVNETSQQFKENMKRVFDKRAKQDSF